MNYDGLIPEQQKPVQPAHPHWRYGTIEDGVKKIDPLLHYGCFTLGFEYPQIVDKVLSEYKDFEFNYKEIIKLFNSDSGKYISSPNYKMTKQKNNLIISKIK